MSKILKIGVWSLLGIWTLGFGVSHAQERGIGVSPAKIEIQDVQEWPHEVPIFVTNFSQNDEQFEVLIEKDADAQVSVLPGRFRLSEGETARVLLTFEKPRSSTAGLIRVFSTETSPEGFTTGTGVKIPFSVDIVYSEISSLSDARFLAAVGNIWKGDSSSWFLGAGMIFATLCALWYIAGSVRTWIFNSSRH